MASTLSNSAATLTYRVAPHPLGYQKLFSTLIVNNAAVNGNKPASRKRWWGSIWGTPEEERAKKIYTAFTLCFARQLEVMQIHVVMSVSCALLSYGQPRWGVLWVTSVGLYFRTSSDAAAITGSIDNSSSTNSPTGQVISTSCSSCEGKKTHTKAIDVEELWEDEASSLREALQFKDIVALLPSIALPTAKGGSPYVSGIPSPIVVPNALQVFTVSPQQIYQFVYMHKVTVVPPSKSLPADGKTPVPLLQHEYDAIQALPDGLDAVIFSALTERVWEARLASLQLPLLRHGVEYAATQ